MVDSLATLFSEQAARRKRQARQVSLFIAKGF
jgi:hypothetical protein